jgi:transposase
MNHVGIDVGQKELVVVVSVNSKARPAKSFDNTATGHQAIIHHLAKLKGETRICLEATGVYHFDDENIALRALGRRIAALNKLKTQAKNQLHALTATQDTQDIVVSQTEELIEVLEKQIKAHRDSALALIRQHEVLARALLLITGIKGIADVSAIQLLAELMVLPSDMNAKQWVAFAGLDPRHNESGTSIAKKPRISKAGNKYIRHALYMPALVASCHEPNIKGYYRHLIENNGLKKLQALCAVMRKLLHAIHGMLKADKEFDGSRFYTMPAEVSC